MTFDSSDIRLVYSEELEDGTLAILAKYGNFYIGGVGYVNQMKIEWCSPHLYGYSYKKPYVKNLDLEIIFIKSKVVNDIEKWKSEKQWREESPSIENMKLLTNKGA